MYLGLGKGPERQLPRCQPGPGPPWEHPVGAATLHFAPPPVPPPHPPRLCFDPRLRAGES
jgi:hypothetical protein